MKRLWQVLLWCVPLAAQAKLAPDTANCADSKVFPRLPNCRIDNCEKKDSDHRDVPVKDDATTAVDGESRSVMYECSVETTPSAMIEQAAARLRTAQFEILYQLAEGEGTLTARKGDLWLLIESASRYYTLVEMKAARPDDESVATASEMAEAIERSGHVAVPGIRFLAGRADIAPTSVLALREVAAMLEEHPEWHVRIESHTDSTGTKAGNMTLSSRRAAAVTTWLVGRGIKRPRLEPVGLGDTKPVADNSTEAGRARNGRIEVVKQ